MIGVDIVVIERIKRSRERFGERFLQKFLTPEEIALVKSDETAAGFWAAKEAIAKALGTGIGGQLGFYDIILSKTATGAPVFTLSQKAAQRFAVGSTSLSIAHDGGFAIAVAAIQRR